MSMLSESSPSPFWPRRSPAFSRLRTAVRNFCVEHYSCLPADITEPVYIGLSGGADSLALVAAACAERLPVHALCIDHGLQEASREVSEQAAQKVRAWGAVATVHEVEVAAGNVEAEARRARYGLFAQFPSVWVAHTADDQAETLLAHLLRGNASVMHGESRVEGAVVYRPLLSCRRGDTRQACQELGVEPWEDPHNSNRNFRRVRIRHELLPLLSEILGGDAVAPLSQAAERIGDFQSLVDPQVEAVYKAAGVAGGGLDARIVEHYGRSIRYGVIARWLAEHGLRCNGAVLAGIDARIINWAGQGALSVHREYIPPAVTGGSGVHDRVVISRIEGVLECKNEPAKGNPDGFHP